MKKKYVVLTTLLLGFSSMIALAVLTGAIFTTGNDGTTVDQNLYNAKEDVYLNGGPQNKNNPGLPDGTYYFQVTDPSGFTLLSTDNASCRQLDVVGGRISGASLAAGSCAHSNGVFNPDNGSTGVQLAPFNDTPNSGGEYKAWLIAQTTDTTIDLNDPTIIHFDNRDEKSDNFKVRVDGGGSGGSTNSISGLKFYDANTNGIQDGTELGIPGWHIELYGALVSNTTSYLTDIQGGYLFTGLSTGTYNVCEVLPANTTPIWVPTTVTSRTNITVPPDSINNNFGNVCLGSGGGLTLGFWSNKNGEKKMNDDGSPNPELALLSSLNLRNAGGTDFNPTTYAQFRTWILGATATNMAYMLSAQLAAMELNVEGGLVNGNSLIYAPGCGNTGLNNNFITISALMTKANTELGLHGSVLSGSSYRSYQECMKNALDNANNDRNFIQATACDVNYSGNEASCAQ